jgi:hypothetical protein
MPCLGSVLYDPSTAVSKSTASAIAMTALDTTNLRIAFTAPPSGRVMVRIRCVVHGATTFPQILLGVLEGSTVRMRQAPRGSVGGTNVASSFMVLEAISVVTVTAGQALTWDAAYGVETAVASSAIKYGGPNNATANDAWGNLAFEVWSA